MTTVINNENVWNQNDRFYTCEDLQNIEGCPKCGDNCKVRRATMILGPRKQFHVCGPIGNWLLNRGVDENFIEQIEMQEVQSDN